MSFFAKMVDFFLGRDNDVKVATPDTYMEPEACFPSEDTTATILVHPLRRNVPRHRLI